ncbi:uncharacterized protein LOC128256897 [Drosophila gunungcola]|uniref:Uncharacterized protein n=1 Tax=Drosophila gunungcola TaxID=103775 RepID=A0A9P9YEZ8_9MUSC|nr:uncharacterized protein LOC128256897 [Drosophila gunungcola]KAI8035757.1 hypothetical protein M5D96_011507 [Drosophila gunungcola]
MLSFLAKRILGTPSVSLTPRNPFHLSAILAKRSRRFCPESLVPDCRVVKKRPCDPTDPPVRPCSEEDCSQPRYPCCVNTRIAENPCNDPTKKSQFVSMWGDYKERRKVRPETLWHYPEECCPPCGDIRFDVLYYRPSDKCREFQRTWWECCPRMVPKRVCCWCDAIPPEVLRRDLPLCPRNACPQDVEKKRYKCLNEKSRCVRMRMPCCRTARIPPDCRVGPSPSDCKKIKCPFPSYSECVQEDPAVIPTRPPECECLANKSACEQVRIANHLAKHNISIWPCCYHSP